MASSRATELRAAFAGTGVELLELATGQPLIESLVRSSAQGGANDVSLAHALWLCFFCPPPWRRTASCCAGKTRRRSPTQISRW